MLTPLVALGLALTSAFADDVPPGADVAARVNAGELAPAVLAALDELRPLAAGWPQLGAAVAAVDGLRQGPWRDALAKVGVDAAAKGAVVTAFVDLADPKRPVFGAVVRGVKPRPAATEGLEPRDVEGQPALVVTGQDLVLVPRAADVVMGNERGVERLLRHLGAPPARASVRAPRDPLVTAARRLRQAAPVLLALVPPALAKGLGADRTPGVAPLSLAVSAATVALEATAFELVLDVDRPGQREAVASAVRGAVAALNGAGQGLLALGELAAAGPQLTPSLPLLPRGLDPKLFATVVTTWMRDLRLTPLVRVRPHGVEARVEVSSWRGLAASALALAASGAAMRAPAPRELPAGVAPAQDDDPGTRSPLAADAESLLVRLREAELAYKHAHGAWLACAALPAQPPREPTPWKADDCFKKVGFDPEGVVTRLQLEAKVEGDKLLLTARADPDGGGAPVVFYLDDEAPTVRRLGPEDDLPATASPSAAPGGHGP